MMVGPLITAAIRFGSSSVIDGDWFGDPNWQARTAATAAANTDAATSPPRAVSPRQWMTWACSCHCPSGRSAVARAATAEIRLSCGNDGVAHTCSNRNRGVVPVTEAATPASAGHP